MTIVSETREVTRLAKQTQAVKDYLEQFGSITNHMAVYQGIPGYGPILRLGARIHDLREKGMNIHTSEEDGTTKYTLARETQPTFAGFQQYLKKLRKSPLTGTYSDRALAQHYLDYCADLKRQNAR
jgi:hypothetical protein